MRNHYTCFYALLILILSGCATINETSKYQFVDGIYKTKVFDNKKTRVYVDIAEDSVAVFRLGSRRQAFNIDTLQLVSIAFPAIQDDSLFSPYNFTQRSFDLDVLTIPFKYRPAMATLPNQLNTNFNGAVYIGYRRDVHRLSYKKAPLRMFERKISHYGVSMGLFTGLGNTAMNPWVTNDHISSEYDGLVWLKGIAVIVGINNFTFGLSLGIDHLLDRNHSVWIYQGKPWVGLAFGLNLN
jgi:hypothetical protein